MLNLIYINNQIIHSEITSKNYYIKFIAEATGIGDHVQMKVQLEKYKNSNQLAVLFQYLKCIISFSGFLLLVKTKNFYLHYHKLTHLIKLNVVKKININKIYV